MTDYSQLAVQLGIRGTLHGKELRALCPFHNDSNPSFSLHSAKGVWICFKCGSGNFYELVERVLNCDPREAREWIENNGNQASIENILPTLKQVLFPTEEIIHTSQTWRILYENLSNKTMPNWFLDRGFTWKTVNHWDIRYDPVWDSVVIPIRWHNELVGTVTRNTIKEPRYENSPGLPRSEILWGEISRVHKDIIICEGALDNLWLWQLEYNSIGLLGTQISQKQIQLLQQLGFGEIILALDNDEAGKKATENAVNEFLKNGWMLPQLTQIYFPSHIKDPQDCNQELFKQLYNTRKSVSTFSIT